jgi:hypothetical protein
MAMEVKQYLSAVVDDMAATASKYAGLMEPDRVVIPIPFFGQVDRAHVLTVGVNPSAREFKERGWPNTVDTTYLANRLLHYFENPEILPHPWFHAWSNALRCLGVAYESGTAAHIDVSPRATIAMSKVDPDEFLYMATHDVKWLFELLGMLTHVRLVLIAGCVTKKLYLNQFLRDCAGVHGWTVLGEAEQAGKGRVGYHAFTRQGKTLPSFFCSVSPSGNDVSILADRISEHSGQLLEIVHGRHPGWTSNKRMERTALPRRS